MSWEQLAAILEEGRQAYDEERSSPPTACPRDGEPLEFHDGVWHCVFDGYQFPRDGYG